MSHNGNTDSQRRDEARAKEAFRNALRHLPADWAVTLIVAAPRGEQSVVHVFSNQENFDKCGRLIAAALRQVAEEVAIERLAEGEAEGET